MDYVLRGCKLDQQDYNRREDDDNVVVDTTERGVSGAMSTIYSPELRIHMLLIHGMLHLVGYDHIEEDDYEIMVQKEEEILQKLIMIDQQLEE